MGSRQEVIQPDGLISVLLNSSAEFGDRHDAAMDLAEYDQPAVEQALLDIALDAASDADLADEAGHSLWQIWRRQGKQERELVARMHPAARKFFD
jgi:hypothetical protein